MRGVVGMLIHVCLLSYVYIHWCSDNRRRALGCLDRVKWFLHKQYSITHDVHVYVVAL